ncbi:2-phosphosulfolactate phosphatase [Deinococcus roseus]|uniref:Probable 2-phosphosulfolactate phosphatase n=1 Tax=Deinococcus roseus TaxID=392414 RepID=A0ABQ2D161_9DEIO|nr:2-phosphosulfolactate phosphatase [Deinococcus roseus]GGJ40877.1 hypothetical protein GCM10008938_28640 [Deinococcus roseus]
MFFDQSPYPVRFEWGEQAIQHLAPHSEAVVVVDVLSFSTCVEVALSRKAQVLPYRWKDHTARQHAQKHGALLASSERRFDGQFSLSPVSLQTLPEGAKLVLPSPNGASLSALAAEVPGVQVFTACLRNARAVGEFLRDRFSSVLLVAAGEKWMDGTLRPAIEDLWGCGAVIQALDLPGSETRSPEAEMARVAFEHIQQDVLHHLQSCASGRELVERGFAADVLLAGQLNTSRVVPHFLEETYGWLEETH